MSTKGGRTTEKSVEYLEHGKEYDYSKWYAERRIRDLKTSWGNKHLKEIKKFKGFDWDKEIESLKSLLLEKQEDSSLSETEKTLIVAKITRAIEMTELERKAYTHYVTDSQNSLRLIDKNDKIYDLTHRDEELDANERAEIHALIKARDKFLERVVYPTEYELEISLIAHIKAEEKIAEERRQLQEQQSTQADKVQELEEKFWQLSRRAFRNGGKATSKEVTEAWQHVMDENQVLEKLIDELDFHDRLFGHTLFTEPEVEGGNEGEVE